MDTNNTDSLKRVLNISNTFWNQKVFRKITVKQCLIFLLTFVLTIVGTVLFGIFVNLFACILFGLAGITCCFVFTAKQCEFFRSVKSLWQYLFTRKTEKIQQIDSYQNMLEFNKKKYVFYEIICNPLIGSDEEKLDNINTVVESFKQLKNWSIISTTLPFVDLEKNVKYMDSKLKDYIKEKFNNKTGEVDLNDPIYRNILVNQYLVENYSKGNWQKKTFLFCLEFDGNTLASTQQALIRDINRNLKTHNFKLKPINNALFEHVKNNLFFFNKEIKIKPKYIKCEDTYYHYFKITGLNGFVDYGYLDFLNSKISSTYDVDVDFAINTFSLKKEKKEAAFWENAVKLVQRDIEKAKKEMEKEAAERDYDAVLEITRDLTVSNTATQKYEIVVRISSTDLKKLMNQKASVYREIKTLQMMKIDNAWFNQFAYFSNFQRNIFNPKIIDKRYNLLPNNLIFYSYPFLNGNTYCDEGFYLGEMYNGNPYFFSLNSGKKENNSTLIVGSTGSGKTTFIKNIIKNNCSEQNVATFVLDPKGEFATVKEILNMNPRFINIDNTNDVVLNPFEISETDNVETKITFMLNFLQLWFENDWSDFIRSILLDGLKRCLKTENGWNFQTLYNFSLELKDTRENRLIKKTLEEFMPDGIYGYFSKETKFSFDASTERLIIFNLSSILKTSSSVNMSKLLLIFKYLQKYIYQEKNLVDENGKKIQIIIDEFPALTSPKTPFITDEIVSFIRLIRSYDASIVLAMQDFSKLKMSGAGESLSSVSNNVKHVFILKQNKEQIDYLKEVWGESINLSYDEVTTITKYFTKGDVLYSDAGGSNRFYFVASDPVAEYSPFDKEEMKEALIKRNEEIVSNLEKTLINEKASDSDSKLIILKPKTIYKSFFPKLGLVEENEIIENEENQTLNESNIFFKENIQKLIDETIAEQQKKVETVEEPKPVIVEVEPTVEPIIEVEAVVEQAPKEGYVQSKAKQNNNAYYQAKQKHKQNKKQIKYQQKKVETVEEPKPVIVEVEPTVEPIIEVEAVVEQAPKEGYVQSKTSTKKNAKKSNPDPEAFKKLSELNKDSEVVCDDK